MKTTHGFSKIVLFLLGAAMFAVASARADTYWWTNFQSDDAVPGVLVETLIRAEGAPLQFDGLWDLLPFGDGVYFTAGIADEEHGLFGMITEDEN